MLSILDLTQGKIRVHLGNALQGKDLFVQKTVIGAHVRHYHTQHEVRVTGHREALQHFGIGHDLLFELLGTVDVMALQ